MTVGEGMMLKKIQKILGIKTGFIRSVIVIVFLNKGDTKHVFHNLKVFIQSKKRFLIICFKQAFH